jgi:RNA polymerase sigma-70 factor (ECF subfamily)
MSDETSISLNTNDLWYWVTELQAGRPNAAEPTFRKIMEKVDRFARGMFQKFPRVGRFVDVEDVVQNSLIRLLAAFRQVRPNNRQHFYAIVNELIRRELLDLVKHYYGPRGEGTHVGPAAVGAAAGQVVPAAPDEAGDLDRLAAFHEAVAGLPAEEREVVGLTYYHGWSQGEISDLFRVSVRTVQRWQESAMEKLKGKLVG